MIGSFRNFAKTKFAGILVFLMIIPFVFWGMGSMFSTGNTNNIAKINKKNISTEEFFDHINQTSISEQTIRDNLSENIIEELLSTLISTTLLELEIEDFNILVSEDTLLKIIKSNKDFHNNEGNFERTKYERKGFSRLVRHKRNCYRSRGLSFFYKVRASWRIRSWTSARLGVPNNINDCRNTRADG